MDAWLERLVAPQLDSPDGESLVLSALLGSGDEGTLARIGIDQPKRSMLRLAGALPLYVVGPQPRGESVFHVHDLVSGFVSDRIDAMPVRFW